MVTTGAAQIKGWVLYDGSCGFCSRSAPFWENTLKRRGIHIAPLQLGWVAEKLHLPQRSYAATKIRKVGFTTKVRRTRRFS